MNQLVTGKFIALKRKQKNLTQEQLAEKLGVSNKTTLIFQILTKADIQEQSRFGICVRNTKLM